MAKSTAPKSAPPAANLVVQPADVLDRAADAALKLAGEAPWADLTLRDIAKEAGVPFAELYARAPSKSALMDRLSRRFDQAALKAADDPSPDVGDRLFEAVMGRLEAMEPDRMVLIAIARSEGPSPRLARRLALTARALLEASGVDAGGRRGALRLAAMTATWARVLQVWRDDEGALNRTMAEIDKRLKLMRKRLGQVGAGF
jgi:AcrR family transcriptional regulator